MDNNELKSLVVTADNLVRKLREVGEDPRFTAVFQFWQNHGMRYNGPDYVDELDSLEKALKYFTNDTSSGSNDSGSSPTAQGVV